MGTDGRTEGHDEDKTCFSQFWQGGEQLYIAHNIVMCFAVIRTSNRYYFLTQHYLVCLTTAHCALCEVRNEHSAKMQIILIVTDSKLDIKDY